MKEVGKTLSIIGGDLTIVNGRIDIFNVGKCEKMLECMQIGCKMFFFLKEIGWKMLKYHFISVTFSGTTKRG